MNKSNKLTEGALLTAVYIVILLFFVFVPLVGPIGIFLLPIPFVLYTERYGAKSGFFMLIGALILSVIFATIIALQITLFIGIGGIVIGAAMKRGLRPYEIWAQGTLGFIIGILLLFAFAQVVLNINIYEQFDAAQKDSLEMMQSMANQFGIVGNDLQTVLEQTKEQLNMMKDLIPAMIAIMAIFLALITQWLSYKVINRLRRGTYHFPPFHQFNLPTVILWFYLLALIVSLLVEQSSSLGIITFNMITLGSVLLTIQGISFIFFFAYIKKFSKVAPVIVVILTVILPFIMMFIMRFIGILDLGLSMKKRMAESNKK